MPNEELDEGPRPSDPRAEATAVADVDDARSTARAAAARRLARGGARSPALDRLAELAARLLGTASAQVSVISDVEHVAGGAGLPAEVVGRTVPLVHSLCARTVASGEPLVVARAAHDPRVAGHAAVADGRVGCYLGVPLIADDGHVIGALCVFDPAPRQWREGDVALLEQLAGPVVAELELAALTADYESEQLLWQLAMDAAGVGAFDWNLVTGELRWDDRLLDLFGKDRQTFGGTIESFNDSLHPDDRDRVSQALRHAIEHCGEYTAEYRVVKPDGGVRWVAARGRALGDDGIAVRLLGAAFDTTAVQEGEARLARVLESMTSAFFSLDQGYRFTYVNREAERLLGRSRQELVGGSIWELFPAAVGTEFETFYRRAMEQTEAVSFEAYYPPPLDAWYEVRGWPSPDGLSVYFVEITEQRAAREQVQVAARRSALLAKVAAELNETLDTQKAVASLASSVVPDFADWCVVTLLDQDADDADWRRALRDVGSWHADARLRPVVEEFTALRIASATDASFMARALESSDPMVVDPVSDETWDRIFLPGRARELISHLDPRRLAFVPMRGRGRTVGVLTLYRGGDRRSFEQADIDTLREVAERAALALDNTRLYAAQRELAEGLQRSMLTDPPEPDHCEIEVRYRPAAQVAQVGGDWYDAFLQEGGATVVVIGDVVGHDTAAAAAMGQVRNLVRAIAVHSGDSPAEVLVGTDRAMQTLLMDTTATAIVARLEQTDEERERLVTRVRWSNAGHPPPLALHPDGSVAELAATESDLLLGLDPGTRRVESVVTLDRGATLLFFTDGLVERRGQGIDVGTATLRDTLADLATRDLTLGELCDEVLARMFPERADDDVALVGVRLHRQDEPRPPEAGPELLPPNVD
ncbi:SpoIIE family protein phosphatase [Nocardioides caldifontis]|uniref:SpoIIE family protein phosphatase n=1 Tax=Nocardioides caldifontis TaxID=2588938 RepID=UPI0011DF2AEA|nr:SpoIIE family protein phosphatase [Nocardioides caldifontis]